MTAFSPATHKLVTASGANLSSAAPVDGRVALARLLQTSGFADIKFGNSAPGDTSKLWHHDSQNTIKRFNPLTGGWSALTEGQFALWMHSKMIGSASPMPEITLADRVMIFDVSSGEARYATVQALLNAGRGELVIEEFTEDATWVAPSGVEAIEYISLTGGTGTTVAWQATFVSVASIASGNTQSFGLNTLESHAEGEFSKFSGLGSTPQSISGDVMRRLANNFTTNASYSGVYRREPGETVSKAGGSGSGWGETGTWNPGDQLYDWNITGIEQRISDDAPGGDTTGFGHTADGGDIGDPGETVVHESVSIVPEQSYDLTVPSGGKIEIRYYEQGI